MRPTSISVEGRGGEVRSTRSTFFRYGAISSLIAVLVRGPPHAQKSWSRPKGKNRARRGTAEGWTKKY